MTPKLSDETNAKWRGTLPKNNPIRYVAQEQRGMDKTITHDYYDL